MKRTSIVTLNQLYKKMLKLWIRVKNLTNCQLVMIAIQQGLCWKKQLSRKRPLLRSLQHTKDNRNVDFLQELSCYFQAPFVTQQCLSISDLSSTQWKVNITTKSTNTSLNCSLQFFLLRYVEAFGHQYFGLCPSQLLNNSAMITSNQC